VSGQRRVHFHENPVSDRVEIPRAPQGKLTRKKLKLSGIEQDFFPSREYTQVFEKVYEDTPPLDVSTAAIEPELVDCDLPVTEVTSQLVPNKQFIKVLETDLKANGILTIGNLASLQPAEIRNIKGIKPVKDKTVSWALRNLSWKLKRTKAAQYKKSPVVEITTKEEEEKIKEALFNGPSPDPTSPHKLEFPSPSEESPETSSTSVETADDSLKNGDLAADDSLKNGDMKTADSLSKGGDSATAVNGSLGEVKETEELIKKAQDDGVVDDKVDSKEEKTDEGMDVDDPWNLEEESLADRVKRLRNSAKSADDNQTGAAKKDDSSEDKSDEETGEKEQSDSLKSTTQSEINHNAAKTDEVVVKDTVEIVETAAEESTKNNKEVADKDTIKTNAEQVEDPKSNVDDEADTDNVEAGDIENLPFETLMERFGRDQGDLEKLSSGNLFYFLRALSIKQKELSDLQMEISDAMCKVSTVIAKQN